MIWTSELKDKLNRGEPVWLHSVRIPVGLVEGPFRADAEGLILSDVQLAGGKFAAISPPIEPQRSPQGMIWPTLVDCHTHIDKGLVARRYSNPDGSFSGAQRAFAAEYAGRYPLEDMLTRAEFQLASAYANGTSQLRSHVDVTDTGFAARFAALCDLAARWQGKVDVQLLPFFGPEQSRAQIEALCRMARDKGQPAISGFIHAHPRATAFLADCFEGASAHGLDLDFHADETLDPNSDFCVQIADAALEHRFKGRVLIGHAVALSAQPKAEAAATINRLAEAGIGVVALPECNAYLMDRDAPDPVLRGTAPVHALRAAGVEVAIGSDNMADGFHAYGGMDLVESFRFAVRLIHLDHPVGPWPQALSTIPARLMKAKGYSGLSVGQAADFIAFNARNWTEFMCRPQSDRLVVRGGRALSESPPEWRQLDHLEGITP